MYSIIPPKRIFPRRLFVALGCISLLSLRCSDAPVGHEGEGAQALNGKLKVSDGTRRGFNQSPEIFIFPDSTSTLFDENFKSSVDSAFRIASAVFNSKEFKDSLIPLSFKFSSWCKENSCKYNAADNGSRISGSEVLNRLFNEKKVALHISLNRKGNALGATCPGQYATTANYVNIMDDMGMIFPLHTDLQ